MADSLIHGEALPPVIGHWLTTHRGGQLTADGGAVNPNDADRWFASCGYSTI